VIFRPALSTAAIVASEGIDVLTDVAVPIVAALVAGSVAAAIITQVFASADKRREHYAEAVAAMVSWCEYPYMIRRRVDDESSTLQRLAQHGHELQERITLSEAWVASEDKAMGEKYSKVIAEVKGIVAPLLTEAWTTGPVSGPGGMVLDGWGRDACARARNGINDFRMATRDRFGWRRLF
jgi:hypothetical protein